MPDVTAISFAGFSVLALIAILLLLVAKQAKPQVFNCMPVTALGNRLDSKQWNNDIETDYDDNEADDMEGFASYSDLDSGQPQKMDDPYFNSQTLMPSSNPQDPEWVHSFTDGNDKLLQQNFIDSQNYEKFQVTRSVCGRRFMSRDLRRTPTVTRDPTTVNSFNLPVIDPVCAKEYNEIRPPLDCF